MCQNARLACGHKHLFIPHALQIPLGYRYVFVPQYAAQTEQINTILQFLMGECVAAGVRRNADKGIDADIRRRFFINSQKQTLSLTFPSS